MSGFGVERGNAGISTIRYNLLNLPEIVQFSLGHQNWYLFGAGGNKLTATSYTLNTAITVPQGTISQLPPNPADYVKVTTDYIGNIIYQNGSLKQIQTSEGYCQSVVYYYYLKDHLGNTRLVINSSGTKIEQSHYYPFGARFYLGSTTNSAAIGFRYNGKEYDPMNGLNRYDYGARFYDPQIGRWNVIDGKAEKYPFTTPYTYALNNPLKFIDPNGNEVIDSFTDKTHNAALANLVSTQEGRAFLNRYLKQGESFMGIIGDGKGDRSHDILQFKSAEMFGGIVGGNKTYTKNGRFNANDVQSKDEVMGGFRQVITLGNGLNEVDATMVIGHESFVHADKDADNLTRINEKIQEGGYNNLEDIVKDIVSNVIETGTRDHKNLKEGKVKKYENYSKELSAKYKNDKYVNKYKEDKNNPNNN